MLGAALIAATALPLLGSPPPEPGTMVLQVAPDPERRGPAALTWVREHALPRLPGWPRGLAPLGALSLEISAAGWHFEANRHALADGDYFAATIALPQGGVLHVAAGFDGLEHWSGEGLGAPDEVTARALAALGLDRPGDPCVLDVAALVGNWLPAVDSGDPMHDLVTMGAAECGRLTVKVIADGPSLRVVGRSPGGLLVPAALAWFAARSAGDLPAADDAVAHWILLAKCARDERRHEALRQLALRDEPAARDTVARLLHGEGTTRLVAMDALRHRRGPTTLEQLEAAATPTVPGSENLVEATRRQWLGRAAVLPGDAMPHRSSPDRLLALAASVLTAIGLAVLARRRPLITSLASPRS